MVERYIVYWANLDPAIGSEIKKKRPVVILSPNEMNRHLNTVIVAPLTRTLKPYPFRVNVIIGNKRGMIALDHMRSIDKQRLSSFTPQQSLSKKEIIETNKIIFEIFSF